MKSFFVLILIGFAAWVTVPRQTYAQGAITLPRSLDQLTEESAVIVHGYVVSLCSHV